MISDSLSASINRMVIPPVHTCAAIGAVTEGTCPTRKPTSRASAQNRIWNSVAYPSPMHHRRNVSGGNCAYSFCCLFKPFFYALTVGASAHGLQNANGGVFINVFRHFQHHPILTVCRTSGIFQPSALRPSAPTAACNAGSTVYATIRNFRQVSISCRGKKAF